VKHSFGMLTQCWGGGGFWRPFQPIHRYHENVREGDSWSVFNNVHDDDDALRGRAYGERRRHIASLLERNGIIRLYMPP
jgi:hypothetical protein